MFALGPWLLLTGGKSVIVCVVLEDEGRSIDPVNFNCLLATL